MSNPKRITASLRLTVLAPLALISVMQTSCTTTATTSSPARAFVIDDQTHQAQGQDERIKFVVLHYTAETDEQSAYKLTHDNVSAHYLIPTTNDNTIYQLVDEHARAWHAGRGSFAGRTGLNDTSIGIEIVNAGINPQYLGVTDPATGYHPYRHFVDFEAIQIQKIGELVQDISTRYNIDPKNIIGHSDMAPSRKIDPGARFPWQALYEQYGVGAWYDGFDKQRFMGNGSYEIATIGDAKQALRDYGYEINNTETDNVMPITSDWDRASQNVVYAFQLHFRPLEPNGIMDAETYAILRALNFKYNKAE